MKTSTNSSVGKFEFRNSSQANLHFNARLFVQFSIPHISIFKVMTKIKDDLMLPFGCFSNETSKERNASSAVAVLLEEREKFYN